MSDYLKPSLYNGKGIENQLRNCIYSAHDLCCGCSTPKSHLLHILDPPEWRPSTTGKEKDTTATDGDHFDEGDLARIFDQDFTEDEPR